MATAFRTTATRIIPTIASTSSTSASARHAFIHTRVPLPYDVNAGLKDFLSPKALKTIAVDWQEGLLTKLNELVKGTEYENLSVYKTVRQTAPDPTHALTFNYASEALNNSFFLSTLSATPTNINPQSSFARSLIPAFESFPGLISHLSAHASGLHPSSGAYVWLVTDHDGNLGVLGTYAGGTLMIQGARRAGKASASDAVLGEIIKEKATESAEESPAWRTAASPTSTSSDTAPSLSSHPTTLLSHAGSLASFGSSKTIHPLVCISLHPHCYLEDYGVWGREEYVKKWWGAVDWHEVERTYDDLISHSKRQ